MCSKCLSIHDSNSNCNLNVANEGQPGKSTSTTERKITLPAKCVLTHFDGQLKGVNFDGFISHSDMLSYHIIRLHIHTYSIFIADRKFGKYNLLEYKMVQFQKWRIRESHGMEIRINS